MMLVSFCEDMPLCRSCGRAVTAMGLLDGDDGDLMECNCSDCGASCFCEAAGAEREARWSP